MRIEEVKPSQRKKGRYLVKLDGGVLLRVTEEELLRFGLRAGMELDDGTMEALQTSARSSSAKAQAANIIGSRPLSKRELTRRLVQKGNEETDAQAAADWLEDLGAVDDWPATTAPGATAPNACGRSCAAGGSPGSCGRMPWQSCRTAAKLWTP